MEKITKDMFKSLFLIIVVWLEIVLEKIIEEAILMICRDRSIWQYYLIIIDMSDNYDKQMVTTGIKLGI